MNDLKWCLNDDPHSEHWAYNEFNGRNYCSGRPEGRSVNEYTTANIRDAWVEYNIEEPPAGEYIAMTIAEASDVFDAWIAEHDRQVAERAWYEGWDASERFGYPIDGVDSETYKNPYTKENNA